MAVLGWLLLATFFLLWNLPVAFAQAMVKLQSVAQVFESSKLHPLAEAVRRISPEDAAKIEGWLASLTLSTLQMATLYSGLLDLLARLMGHSRNTAVGVATLTSMCALPLLRTPTSSRLRLISP